VSTLLRPASEDEVVAAFLRAEADETGRYRDALLEHLRNDGQTPQVLSRPDLADPRQNAYRRRLLGDIRGFGRNEGMFIGFPPRVEWHRMALSREELLEVRYIDDRDSDDYWVTLSGGSRRPDDAAVRIRAGIGPGWAIGVWDLAGCAAVVRRLREGSLPELIVVTTPRPGRMVVLEGNARLTCFALYADRLPEAIEVFCGIAEGLDGWGLY
jgi:hypothetical protein